MNKSFFRIGKLSGKASAAVICFCLAAVAAAGVYTYNKSDITAEQKLSGTSDAAEQLPEPACEPASDHEPVLDAEAVQDNIPVEDMLPEEASPVYNNGAEEANEADENDAVSPPIDEAVPFESGTALMSGILVRPLDGDIICDFSDGELVKSETLGVWKTHDGIDIAGSEGDRVRAAAAGTVSMVYNDPMWGICAVICHESGYESYYCGLDEELFVSEGDNVSAGTEIGTLGNTAECEAAEPTHLHFGLKKGGKWVDPAEALSGMGS